MGQGAKEIELRGVYDMLTEVKESLSEGNHDIGMAKVEPHKIEMIRETPIWQKPRNFSEPVNREIHCKNFPPNNGIKTQNIAVKQRSWSPLAKMYRCSTENLENSPNSTVNL